MESKHHVESETPHMLLLCVPSTRLDRTAGRAGAVGSAGSSGRRDVGQRRQRIPLFFPTAQRPGRPSRVQAALRSNVRNFG
jgi:hypothetical protein